jgi:hypothetical protein
VPQKACNFNGCRLLQFLRLLQNIRLVPYLFLMAVKMLEKALKKKNAFLNEKRQ